MFIKFQLIGAYINFVLDCSVVRVLHFELRGLVFESPLGQSICFENFTLPLPLAKSAIMSTLSVGRSHGVR